MRKLYLVDTKQLGDFFVVATNYDEAEQKVAKNLNKADYGFNDRRVVSNIKLLASEITEFPKGKPNFSVDGDIIIID